MDLMNTALDTLQNNFPVKVRSLIVPAISRGYSMADQLVKNNDMLDWAVGRDNLPYLRRIAVDFELARTLTNGPYGINMRINKNFSKNYHHLELITSDFITTISHVDGQYRLPRKAVFRSNYYLSNQLTLPFGRDYEYQPSHPYYALITHGSEGLVPAFCNLGVPAPNAANWLARINLMSEPHLISNTTVTVEEVEENLVALRKFKERVVELE